MGSDWRPLPEELPLSARLLTEQLRALKDANGLSLADLAAATHYSRASWERWLNGKRLITHTALIGFTTLVEANTALLLTLHTQATTTPATPPTTAPAAPTTAAPTTAAPAPPSPSAATPVPPKPVPTPRVPVTPAPRDRSRQRPTRRVVVLTALCAVLVAATLLVVALTGTGASAGTSQLSQARALLTLLNTAADNRAVAVAAVVDIEQCQSLPQSAADLDQMGRLRAAMVTQLSRLRTDRLAQHQALVSALDQGWQASQRADDDYANWAQASAAACTAGHRPAATAWKLQGDEASADATAAKQRAAVLWNAVATANGLSDITADQL